jgi:hypothetical protein
MEYFGYLYLCLGKYSWAQQTFQYFLDTKKTIYAHKEHYGQESATRACFMGTFFSIVPGGPLESGFAETSTP